MSAPYTSLLHPKHDMGAKLATPRQPISGLLSSVELRTMPRPRPPGVGSGAGATAASAEPVRRDIHAPSTIEPQMSASAAPAFMTALEGNYFQDPYQKTFIRFPEFNAAPTEREAPRRIILSDTLFGDTAFYSPLQIPDLRTMKQKNTRRTPPQRTVESRALSYYEDSAPSSIDIDSAVVTDLIALKKAASFEDSHSPEISPAPHHPITPERLPWTRIPLLLELYLHLHRITQALIAEEGPQRSLAKAIWLSLCIDLSTQLSQAPFKDGLKRNKQVASNRLQSAHVLEKHIILELKTQSYPIRPDWKSHLLEHTAGPLELLFINQRLGFQTLIQSPQYGQSSHSKKTMPPAVMPMIYTFRNPTTGELSTHTRYRVPSIGSSRYDKKEYSPKANLAWALELIPGSATRLTCYHLLTSLPKIDPNHQAKTAEELFQAVHQFNQESGAIKAVIFNIAVNQHTEILSYTRPFFRVHRKTIPEALVMADLALILKLKTWRSLDPKNISRIALLERAYSAFLASYDPKKIRYFSEYVYAHPNSRKKEKVIDILSFLKKALLDETFTKSDSYSHSPRDLMEKALIKLYVIKYDGNLENIRAFYDQRLYGLSTQALFMALDDHNLAGCKSANERFFLAEGLAQVLLAFMEQTLPSAAQQAMTQGFKKFLAPDLSQETFESFAQSLLTMHNALNPYGSSIGPSLLDTGTPKCDVEASQAGNPLEINALLNTNIFAPRLYSHIQQRNASSVQAHGKDLPDRLQYLLTHDGNPEILKNARILAAAKSAHIVLTKRTSLTEADWSPPLKPEQPTPKDATCPDLSLTGI
jgi:hypothetical protein